MNDTVTECPYCGGIVDQSDPVYQCRSCNWIESSPPRTLPEGKKYISDWDDLHPARNR